MREVTRESLIKGLENLQGHLCDYYDKNLPKDHGCDCEYGFDELDLDDQGWCEIFGEHSGCCEVQIVCAIIKSMTNEEFNSRMEILKVSDILFQTIMKGKIDMEVRRKKGIKRKVNGVSSTNVGIAETYLVSAYNGVNIILENIPKAAKDPRIKGALMAIQEQIASAVRALETKDRITLNKVIKGRKVKTVEEMGIVAKELADFLLSLKGKDEKEKD